MRRMSKTATSAVCRGCNTRYSRIRGIFHYDRGCCSESCYLQAGPAPVNGAIPEIESQRPKKKKSRQKHRRGKSKKDLFHMSPEWLTLRYHVLRMYGRVCMCCGKTRGEMHVDHIKPRSRYPQLALVFDNLQVLCKECNFGKSNKDETDYRRTIPVTPVVAQVLDT